MESSRATTVGKAGRFVQGAATLLSLDAVVTTLIAPNQIIMCDAICTYHPPQLRTVL